MQSHNQYVLVEPINQNDIKAQEIAERSGLIYKPKYQGAPDRGYVRFISNEIKTPLYKVGDVVLFKNDIPDGFKYNGVSYLPIEHNQIMAVLK